MNKNSIKTAVKDFFISYLIACIIGMFYLLQYTSQGTVL
ncbi:hypothetical protein CACET_c29030 [Clostridium aceticum]|uniref:Uncharacterized protein n=1 Tax=Clostridium aceticum TaxID=84022 RepID=A0A0G3WDB3_9CLOT|nr:hypothetical protein CACET_c29030 [Clostridium aceticum]